MNISQNTSQVKFEFINEVYPYNLTLKAFRAIANRNNRSEICKNINKERININENS